LDCSALITRQLAELAALVARLQAGATAQESVQLVRELTNRAVLHVLSRERLLLPAWRRARRHDVPSDALAAHARFKQALADLVVLQPGELGFADALAALARQVECLRSLDHGRLIPTLRHAMDVDERRELFNDIELMFETGSPPVLRTSRAEQSPGELIREAKVVLSSITARKAPTV